MIRLAYQFGPSIYSCAYLKNESPAEMYRRLCFVPFIYEDEIVSMASKCAKEIYARGKGQSNLYF